MSAWIPADKAPAGHEGIVVQQLAEGTWRYVMAEWRERRGIEGWFDSEGACLVNCTYWMPLPEPPTSADALAPDGAEHRGGGV